jgi:F-type H+-transporting ATPase subunit delta
MPTTDFQIQAIVSVYAEALIHEAQKQNVLEDIIEDIRGIDELLRGDETFRRFTEALTIGEDERLSSLDKIFSGRVHVLTLNTLKAMSRRDRFMFLPAFLKAFNTLLRKMDGIIDAYLTTAAELPQATLDRIKSSLAGILNKTVELHVKVAPALVGGITLTVGDTLFDASVATQLKKLEDQLQRTNQLKLESAVSEH